MPAAISDEALNRYRIAHPDKELRTLSRRIHTVYHASTAAKSSQINGEAIKIEEGTGDIEEDAARERETTRLEVLKWKIGVERVLASAGNLKRQGERYRKKAEETSAHAQQLESTLEEEKRLLVVKRKERDHMIRCDEVYAKITSRPRTKEELKEHIITLRAQIDSHRTSRATFLEIAQCRVDAFAAIPPIIEDVRSMKLPIDTSTDTADESMDIDTPSQPEPEDEVADERKLSASALPFQPTTAGPSAPRSGTIAPPTAPSSRATAHGLPHRPARKSPSIPTAPSSARIPAGPGGRAASASLPQRPSALRSSVTPVRNSLEEGEVEGEEGEVDDRKTRGAGRRR